jgi:hypothetical protein
MKHNFPIVLLALAGVLLVPCIGSAQVKDAPESGSVHLTAAQARGNLCAKTDLVVFSCVLDGGKKSVSLCASADKHEGQRHFRYVFGRSSAPELVFPSGDEAAHDAFTRSNVWFMGGIGAYAYAFVREDYKYILYSIAGAADFLNVGLLVQRVGDLRAVSSMKCQRASIVERLDDEIFNETNKWKRDSEIESAGLPWKN